MEHTSLVTGAVAVAGCGFRCRYFIDADRYSAAFLLARANIRGKAAILAFVLSPIVAPRIIIAVGLFYVFAELGLVGTSIGLIIGHTVVCVPYVVMTMVAVLRNYDTRLDLAAQSLGASPVKSLAYVTFPYAGRRHVLGIPLCLRDFLRRTHNRTVLVGRFEFNPAKAVLG